MEDKKIKVVKRDDRTDITYALRHADSLLTELIKLNPERARKIIRQLTENREQKAA